MGAICAIAGFTIANASVPVINNARQLSDIELNLFISNENPSTIQPLQRHAIARQSPRRHSRPK